MAVLDEKTLVRSIKRMNDVLFERHMKYRHDDSLSYMINLPLHDESLMRMWRVFHNHLHRWRIDLDHEHSEP